jgi:hypothetical protein
MAGDIERALRARDAVPQVWLPFGDALLALKILKDEPDLANGDAGGLAAILLRCMVGASWCGAAAVASAWLIDGST